MSDLLARIEASFGAFGAALDRACVVVAPAMRALERRPA